MSNKKNRFNMVEVETEDVTNIDVTDTKEETVVTTIVKPKNKFIAACDKWGKGIKKGTSEIWEATPKPVKFVLGGIAVVGLGLIAKGYVSSRTEGQACDEGSEVCYDSDTDGYVSESNDAASEEYTCESMIDTDVVENVRGVRVYFTRTLLFLFERSN